MKNITEIVDFAKKSNNFSLDYASLIVNERLIVREMLQNGQLTKVEAEAWYKKIGSEAHLRQTVDALFVTQEPESLPALVILRQQARTNPIK